MNQMTFEEAKDFFSEFYKGDHHIPGRNPIEFGEGWYINHDRGGLSTWDFDSLTKIVLMAHKYCVRVEIKPCTPRILKIAIWRRQREGRMYQSHPTIEQALEIFNHGTP